jgi:hypothetical protein
VRSASVPRRRGHDVQPLHPHQADRLPPVTPVTVPA